jgi:hypothetical protein
MGRVGQAGPCSPKAHTEEVWCRPLAKASPCRPCQTRCAPAQRCGGDGEQRPAAGMTSTCVRAENRDRWVPVRFPAQTRPWGRASGLGEAKRGGALGVTQRRRWCQRKTAAARLIGGERFGTCAHLLASVVAELVHAHTYVHAHGAKASGLSRRKNVGGELVAYGLLACAGVHGGVVGLGSCTKRAQDEA